MTGEWVVLFDLGNVLVSIDPGAFARTLGLNPSASQGERERVINLVRRYEEGRLSTAEYLDHLKSLFDGSYAREQLKEAMLNVIGEPTPGVEDLVRRVSSKATLGLVSNTNELHFTHCASRVPALKFFSRHFLSYQLGLLKPDPAYYAKVLQDFRIDPPRIVFIDDLQENVEAARKAGMSGVQFRSAGGLNDSLTKLGIL